VEKKQRKEEKSPISLSEKGRKKGRNEVRTHRKEEKRRENERQGIDILRQVTSWNATLIDNQIVKPSIFTHALFTRGMSRTGITGIFS
jgi:transposase